MNPLEALKNRLKVKPEVQHNVGVKVIIAPPIDEEKQNEELTNQPVATIKRRTEIIVDKDNGKRAQDILEKIRQKRVTAVVKKSEEPKSVLKATKAPIVAKEDQNPKPRKLKQPIILVEEEEPAIEVLPEGGPRLEEEVVKTVGIENRVEADVPVVKTVGIEDALEEEIFIQKKPRKRIASKAPKGVKELGPEVMIQIGDTPLPKRIPPPAIYDMKVSSYYMNNREIFVNFINNIFEPYKEDLLDETKGISCEDIGKDTGEIGLLTHQKIVRDYMNLYTPYRGLLLYHGLGSGKTCTSIAITIAVAEGLKKSGKVIVMTPASLKRNYIEEIKKCGDLLFRKKQFWEWISIDTNPELIDPLSAALGLPREYIRRKGGAWLTNISKPENYADLTATDKKSLNDQLDEMIGNKYTFINYNGLRRERFRQLTNNFETNIFDNSIVVIDEAHNLISRIVNKVNKISKFSEKKRGPGVVLPNSLALQLYEFLLRAENTRIVLLTGTPIINYPNEIGILFNILRGYIKTWSFSLNADGNKKITKDALQEIFAKEKVMDYFDYVPSSKTLTITRNPLGFENKITASSGYKGVTNEKKELKDDKGQLKKHENGNPIFEERGAITDDEFVKRTVKLLKKHDITANSNSADVKVYTALPDTLTEFTNNFINRETGVVSNIEKFKRRIVGLTSYFRSAQEELLPAYDKEFDKEIVLCPMSDYQFSVYETYRQQERKTEKEDKKGKQGVANVDGLYKGTSSTYKIFSRLACNFVMPNPPGRPAPEEYRVIESQIRSKEFFNFVKEKFAENNEEFTEEIINILQGFTSKLEDENIRKYSKLIYQLLDEYIKKYITENYRESIEIFIRSKGHNEIFDEVIGEQTEVKEVKEAQTNKLEVKNALDKEQKELQKRQEREDLKRRKMEEKEELLKKKLEEKDNKVNAKIAEKEFLAKKKAEENALKKQSKVKIAIIVPFRDSTETKERTKQLEQFTAYMDTYLQGYNYKIFVIEQSDDERKFNRGQLLNKGFSIASSEGYNNFIFHDVDLLPSEELKEYYINIPTNEPIHIAAVWDRYNSNPKYFGGIIALNKEMFKEINGYPNNFWGWGGEDDELYNRVVDNSYNIMKVTKGSINDLENLDLQEKLDYLKENELKFMQKREALAEHKSTWKQNGLNAIRGIKIIKKDSCGPKCEKFDVKLIDTEPKTKTSEKRKKLKETTEDFDEEEEEEDEDDHEEDEDEDFDEEEDEDFDEDEDATTGGGLKTTVNAVSPAEEYIDKVVADEDGITNNLEGYKNEDALLRDVDELEGDEILEKMGSIEYREAIKAALRYLQIHSKEYLSPEGLEKYSPKFLEMLNNIEDHENPGLHLIYSQFRSMEGIGIFSLVLEANGFARFKIKRSGADSWEINMSEEDQGKPCYALYTGTEDDEEREIIRNIYNGQWEYIPNNIAAQLRTRSSNNNLGEIIKVLMITSAGSEGINLRNTRFVHIMEPYWHPVRVEQVIGRARRICSHQSLPKELQTVHVFVYISVLTDKQLKSEMATELRLKDASKLPPFLPQTTDQLLLEISNRKENLSSQLLKGVKESSIDCTTHSKSASKEGLVCLSFGQPNVQDWSYNPAISQDENDTVADINRVTIDWEGREFTLKSTGKKYILRMDTREVYDYDSVIRAKQIPGVRPIKIGKLVKNAKGDYEIVKEKI